MAQSPAHRFGQIIGEVLEESIRSPLEEVCRRHELYLDSKHARPARQGRIKVAWVDNKGNTHDLDYVIEQGGTEERVGAPKAFIEIAWRRYTKHSRNKAQEIQGAIIPLAETYHESHPFLGVVLGGVFTEGSLAQLRSHGFRVLYFPYASLVDAFASVGINAAFDEATADSELATKVDKFTSLSVRRRQRIAQTLRRKHSSDLDEFANALEVSLKRSVVAVCVLPLHGRTHEVSDLTAAIHFLKTHRNERAAYEFVRYEINVRFSNGDEIRGQFQSNASAIEFLASLN